MNTSSEDETRPDMAQSALSHHDSLTQDGPSLGPAKQRVRDTPGGTREIRRNRPVQSPAHCTHIGPNKREQPHMKRFTYQEVLVGDSRAQEFFDDLSGQDEMEIDRPLYDYFLDLLPPVVSSTTLMIRGTTVNIDFGFAEGSDTVKAFYRRGERYFCSNTAYRNPCA